MHASACSDFQGVAATLLFDDVNEPLLSPLHLLNCMREYGVLGVSRLLGVRCQALLEFSWQACSL